MNHPEVAQAALKILRSGENFQWYVITLLALVLYVYANEIRQRNWKGIAAGLSLYMVHWFVITRCRNGVIAIPPVEKFDRTYIAVIEE